MAADAAMPPPAKKAKTDPPAFSETSGEYVAAGDGWWAHKGGAWLYNPVEGTYFHLPTGEVRLADPEAGFKAPVETQEEEERKQLRGRVRWFNAAKGFGFLEPLGAGNVDADVFVHRNQILSSEDDLFAILEPGTIVTYALGQTDNGRPCAVGVRQEIVEEKKPPSKEQNDDNEDSDDEVRKAEMEAFGGSGGGDSDNDEDCDGEGDVDSEASSVEIDVFEELLSGISTQKGPGKDRCEDFAAEKVRIPIASLCETDSVAVFFGVFDGHGGQYCAEYAAAHLAKNILSRLHDRAKNISQEQALRTALLGGFKQTEHNFLQHARKSGDCSGTTACTMTVFGPDEQMRLRLFMANLGDSRAVLGKADGSALRLTEDHKPDLPAEKKRIEQQGGGVAQVAGVWRTLLPQKKARTTGIVGLAVSRALGDKEFKTPDIVSAEPEITIHEVDWDSDAFVILASDGIWDVIPDREAVRIAHRCLQKGGNQEKAAELLVKQAVKKGSHDDCTALVVRFGWLKQETIEGGPAADGGDSDSDATEAFDTQEAVSAMDDDKKKEEDKQENADMFGSTVAAPQAPLDSAVATSSGRAVTNDDIWGAAAAGLEISKPPTGQAAAAAPVGQGLFDDLIPAATNADLIGPAAPTAKPAGGAKFRF